MMPAAMLADGLPPLTGWSYAGLSVVVPVHGRLAGKRLRRLEATSEGSDT